ncbi:MAG: hypothetical protein IIC94_02565 [Chloroflexi bacterium]|nr:hypothetical protein [Chloroflexota bacterium]
MISLKRLSLLMLPAILMLLVAACGDDDPTTAAPTATSPAPEPTATPEPAPDPTATPTTAPEPTATPTPEPEPEAPSGPTTYTFGDFVLEDGKFELRMGATAYFGYDAEQRIPTIPGLIEIVFGPIQVGDTISFARCRQSGSRSTKEHRLTIDLFGLDHNLYGDTGGGPIGDSDDTSNNCEFTFNEPGEFIFYDSTDPDDHGVAKVIVEGEAIAMSEPVVYTLDELRVRETVFELRMGDTIAWGYGDNPLSTDADRIRTDEVGDITITINVGDSLVFPDGLTSSGSNLSSHFITIDELGIDIEIPVDDGGGIQPGYTITPTEAGTFRLYCSAHPEPEAHGNFFIVVS